MPHTERRHKRKAILFLGIFLCLFLNGQVTGESIKPPQVVTNMLDAIQIPTENEFPTPEHVIKAFIAVVRAYEVDQGMKCFPISEKPMLIVP